MIRLIAPPPENPNTGGYLVNARLCEDKRVEQCFAPPANLGEVVNETSGIAVIDSLYLLKVPWAGWSQAGAVAQAPDAVQVLLMAHSLPSFFAASPRQRRSLEEQECRVMPRFRGIIAPSEFMAGELGIRGVAKENICVVTPAPIVDGRGIGDSAHEPRDAAPDNPSHLEVLTIANWSREKGLADAALALSQLTDLDWSWTVAGSQPEGDLYVKKADETSESMSLVERMTVQQSLAPERLALLYGRADLFLLPSFVESYGLVFAEATTFGVPVVGYRAGAVSEAVCGTGSLVDAGNWQALVPVLRRIMENHSFRQAQSARAKAAAQGLPTWPKVRDRFVGAATALWERGAAAQCG